MNTGLTIWLACGAFCGAWAVVKAVRNEMAGWIWWMPPVEDARYKARGFSLLGALALFALYLPAWPVLASLHVLGKTARALNRVNVPELVSDWQARERRRDEPSELTAPEDPTP